MVTVSFLKLESALETLRLALVPPPANDRERDGAIQRFEYCFELCWKTAQKVLKNAGVEAASPKSVIRELGRQGFIDDVERWLDLLENRNLTAHTYDPVHAERVFRAAGVFYTEALKLVKTLKSA